MHQILSDNKVDKEIENFLGPFKKALFEHEDLLRVRTKEHLYQRTHQLNDVSMIENKACDIGERNLERSKFISGNASLIKDMLQDPTDSNDLPVNHQHQKETISVVKGLVEFTNNFPKMLEIIEQTPKSDGLEILASLVCRTLVADELRLVK